MRASAILRLLTAVLVALAWPAAQAAQPTWYTVELIVFSNLDTSGAGDERWPLDPGTPTLDNAVELLDANGLDTAEPGLRFAFRQLPAETLQLNSEWRRLRRSAGFHPLLHVAWRQPGLARDEARAVHLRSHAAPPAGESRTNPAAPSTIASELPAPPEIDGTLRFYRARYLHLNVDLLYQPGMPPPGLEQQASVFRLTESRRVRSRKLYYFDNPLFGVLAMVTPEPEPEPDAAEPDSASPAVPSATITSPAQPAPAAP